MAPLPSEMNFVQRGGGVMMMFTLYLCVCVVVGAGKGQCTVTNGSGLFSHVLPLLHCEQRKGYAVSHL